MKVILAILIASSALAQSFSGGSGVAISGGSGHSLICGGGFTPVPCVARTDTAVTVDPTTLINSNGSVTPFTTGPVNATPSWFIDPFFGERIVRATNGSTASNKSGAAWATPSAGWARDFNCSGTTLGPTCLTAPLLMHAEANGGGVVTFQINRSTLALTRVDTASGFNGAAPNGANLPGPIFDCCDPDRLFINLSGFEDNVSSAAAWSYYELTPSSPAAPTGVTYLNMNTGPLGNAWDNQSGSGGLISAYNGLLNFKNWPIPIAPIICDGTQCIEGMNSTVLTGTTCGGVSGGTAGAGCITVSTSGGSLSGTNTFAITQDDGGTPQTEQNIGGVTSGISLSAYPWTPYNFTSSGNTGEVTAVVAPTKVTSPVTAAHWDFYVAGTAGLHNTQNSIVLAPRQFQVASSIASCSGAGGGGCPALPFTTTINTVSAANPVNFSCEQVTAATSSGKCELTHAQQDNLGDWVFEIGHGQGNQAYAVGEWSPTKGLRYINLATGVVVNGGTDANGNACPATTCWPSTGSGAITFHPDPNTLLSAQTWGGLLLHESAPTLGGTYIYLGIQIGPTGNDGPFWWNVATGDVYGCSTLGAGCNFAGHPAFGYGQFWQTSNNNVTGNLSIDGNLDSRQMTLSGTNCGAGAQCRFSTTPQIQQTFNFSITGPCPSSAPPLCEIPNPNLQTNSGYNLIGSGRADSHESAMNEDTNDAMPFGWIPYNTTNLNLNISTSTNTTRTGCPSACVDTFALNTATAQYLGRAGGGDLVTITGMTDTSFNITGNVTSTGPVGSGTKTFTINDPGKSNGNTVALASNAGEAYKIDNTPGRAWENEVLLIQPAPSSSVPAVVYRIAHAHFDLLGSGTVTGPNVTISPDGHFISWTTTDGSGGLLASLSVGTASTAGGGSYNGTETFTVNNPLTGAVLATGHVTAQTGGVVTGVALDTDGQLYQTPMNNVPTTTTSGPGTGLLVSYTINGTQTLGGRSDVAFAEVY